MKKSQLTLFMIIGLVLLLSTGLILYTFYKSPLKTEDVEFAVQEVPTQISPVQIYIEDCVREIAKDGLVKLGERGGYIEPGNQLLSQKPIDLDRLGRTPTMYDAFALSSGRLTGRADVNDSIPYWWHMRDYKPAPYDEGCQVCLATNELIPTLDEIALQLALYVERELPVCIKNFHVFENEGFVIMNLSGPAVTVFIAEHDVIVNMNYPVEIKKKESVISIEDFEIKIPLEFIRVYNLAKKIALMQMNTSYFEHLILNMVGAYSGIDSSKLPPIADFEEGSRVVRWDVSKVEASLKELFAMNLNLVSIKGTRNANKITMPDASRMQQGIYDIFYWDINISEPDMYVIVQYLGWPIYFDITPQSQGKLEPSVYKQDASPFNIVPASQSSTYEFFYDISVPLVVVIRHPNTLWNDSYTFQFAIEANIRDNRNLLEWNKGEGTVGVWDYTGISFEKSGANVTFYNCTITQNNMYKCNATDMEYAAETECRSRCFATQATAEQLNLTNTFFCDSAQRIAGPVVIKTVNAKTNEPIDSVAVSFGCGEHLTCPLGETTLNKATNEAALVTGLPICIDGGFFRFTKDNYANGNKFDYTAKFGKTDFFAVEMEPFREKNVIIKRIDVGVRERSRQYLYSLVNKIMLSVDMRMLSLNETLPCLIDIPVIYNNIVSRPELNYLHRYTPYEDLPLSRVDTLLARMYFSGYYKDCRESKELCYLSVLNNPGFNESLAILFNASGLNISGNGIHEFLASDMIINRLSTCQIKGKLTGIQKPTDSSGIIIHRYLACRNARIITDGDFLGFAKINNQDKTSSVIELPAFDIEYIFKMSYSLTNYTTWYDSAKEVRMAQANFTINDYGKRLREIVNMTLLTGGAVFNLPDNFSHFFEADKEILIFPDEPISFMSSDGENDTMDAAIKLKDYILRHNLSIISAWGKDEYDYALFEIDKILNQLSTLPDIIPVTDMSLNGELSIKAFNEKAYEHLQGQDYSVILEKERESVFDESQQFAYYITDPSVVNTIKIVPGRYKMTINMLNQSGKVIPAKSSYMAMYKQDCCNNLSYAGHLRLLDTLGCQDQGSVYYPDADQQMAPFIAGGVFIDNQTRLWQVTDDELDADSEIILFVLLAPEISNLDELGFMGMIEEFSIKYRNYTEPVFIEK